MLKEDFSLDRALKNEKIITDFLVVGGGMSGICAAIAAARMGLKVILIQDRPVLGGNASSEVRLWILGATSHMGNNNRWAREGGIIDELLVENLYRNKEGNPLIFDTILLEKVYQEENITLLLNTAAFEVSKNDQNNISSVKAFCSQNSTMYTISSPLFCDASGDGVLGFLAGASFRMGAETKDEFGEGFAPDVKDYGELLGHSIYFYTKDTGLPVKYVAPAFAKKEVGSLPRIKNYKLKEYGCRLWWVEYGGRLDTIHESENIKLELWKVIYGLWDHVKNSGDFPEAENLTLEWVGTIPGKRESRRFEGDYMMVQQDIVEQRQHEDAIAFGGWAMDLHPADGVYSDKSGCTQWHAKGVYQIPYRCFYSKDIDNLFLAGRIISVSHVAFSSTRVMATCAMGGQAVGVAASLAKKSGLKPRDLSTGENLKKLQLELNKMGQSIPFIPLIDEKNLLQSAHIKASSEQRIQQLPDNGNWLTLDFSAAQMLPFKRKENYNISFKVKAEVATSLQFEFRTSSKTQNYTPDVILEKQAIALKAGEQIIHISLKKSLNEDQYAFLTFLKNDDVSIKCSETKISGVIAVLNKTNKAVSNYGRQDPPANIGVDSFEFWTPYRRPQGQNFAFQISPAITCFEVENLNNGYLRPYNSPNAWVANTNDKNPTVQINWDNEVTINEIVLMFDTDQDHALESSLYGHPEDVLPFCIRDFELKSDQSTVVYSVKGNFQTINKIKLTAPLRTKELILEMKNPSENVPAAIFQILIY
ncbi:FAD-dependent oxidoreductase [Pedobacter cryophilus]|uniref:FAD-dependent oxidoreductase n=1 Tax=Pedobacter cryophilus TaxID=2571271 RepID=A0A4U1BVQ2_9SPHI|nr:FAD-dependent oxidoreductase [Pedobacter cryophilus]TKB96885.1 FAD-dependent oxidoreductase [Pedobacter cryophilus]